MAIAAAAQWRCRPDGSDTNGAGFDPSTYPSSTFTGTIGNGTSPTTSGNVLNVTTAVTGTALAVGTVLGGPGLPPGGVTITSLGTGTGGSGTYILDTSLYQPSTSYTAGTDNTQRATPVLALTDLASAGSATAVVTSATGGFTAAMKGTAVYVAGTGFTTARYFIATVTSSTQVTLDRTPASSASAASAGTCNVGGAALNPLDFLKTTGPVVSGNRLMVRGSGSRAWVQTTLSGAMLSGDTSMSVASATGFPASGTFYAIIELELVTITAGAGTTSWTITRASGGTTAAAHASGKPVTLIDYPPYTSGITTLTVTGGTSSMQISTVGENGRPKIFMGSTLKHGGYSRYESMGFAILPSLLDAQVAFESFIGNSELRFCCVLALNSAAAGVSFTSGYPVSAGSHLVHACEYQGDLDPLLGGSGAAPFATNNYSAVGSYGGGPTSDVEYCVFRYWPGSAVAVWQQAYFSYRHNVSYKLGGDHVGMAAQSAPSRYDMVGNTFDGGGLTIANGIAYINGVGFPSSIIVRGNIFANFGTGKVGYNQTGSGTPTQATQDMAGAQIHSNAYYNNATHATGISLKPSDIVGVDPGFVDAANGNHSIGPNLRALGFPTTTQIATRSYIDVGAAQRQEPSAGLALSRPEIYNVG